MNDLKTLREQVPATSLQRVHEELARHRLPETPLQRLQHEVQRYESATTAVQRASQQREASWVAKSFGLHLPGAESFKPVSSASEVRQLVEKSLERTSPEQLQAWARQIRERPQYYERLIETVVGPRLATTLVQQFIKIPDAEEGALPTASAATAHAALFVLDAPTLEGAYRALAKVLSSLDPVQQLFLTVFIGPLLVGLVYAFVNPIAEHWLKKKWLDDDSPQGRKKRARQEAVAAVGGTSVLAEFRMVSTQNLVVRASAAAKGKKVAALSFGTAIRVLRRAGAFTLIEWSSGDGSVTGWVYTRYLKRFD
ncbi:hypothetical protein [Ramlibacter humi]|uniref:SH3 domain-containing protein n=1 Tax=Ramlibacter humi TaxID=2530451 RepID=A0A4Z0CD80_9BURK|nr:hypothetical protein [Ramlibacter humi]TFZ08932.1 hypothetical protein EZ216_07260 [Ramlibacter humi]